MEKEISAFKNHVIHNFSREDFAYRDWIISGHIEIVERIAMELCGIYVDADREIVQALVWFHDYGKPFDEENEKEITLRDGAKALRDCGFQQEFIDKVVHFWQLMEKKNDMDLSEAPIETQIISSADGASHFVGTFYATYFSDGFDFATTQDRLRKKMDVDWNKKITLPEVKKAFHDRYLRAREMLGEYPDAFLGL